MQCFRNFPVAKKVMDKGGGGIKTFRRKISLSQSRKNVQGNPLLFHYFQASKNVRNKRKGGGGNIKIFRRKIFLSQC